MRKQSLQLNDLHLRNLQIVSNVANTKRSIHGPKSNRTLMKLYLTKQILEQCLDTFDIFKEILEDPIQKNKLIRDVMKNIHLRLYDEDANIYNKGDISESIYLVIKGEVSLCLPVLKQSQDPKQEGKDDNKQIEYEYKEIDIFKEGVGFGEAEFIQSKKRGLVAKVKIDGTVVGCISANSFEQIIELYRQRVYYKKIQMFSKCLLLKNLTPYQLEFIVNNAKPITFSISKQIVSEGERPKALYLITSGQVELCRQQKPSDSKIKTISRSSSEQSNHIKMQIKKVIVGGLQQGEFLGDCQLALNQHFNFSAICKSQKVKAYICDQRIITSQLNSESLQLIKYYFSEKQEYRLKKMDIYEGVKRKMHKNQIQSQQIALSVSQMKIKRKIMNRYVQKTPTLIGKMSPREIGKIVDRKYARFKTDSPQRSQEAHFTLPNISKTPVKKLVRNEGALSPLLKRKKENAIRKYSEPAEDDFGINSFQNVTKLDQIKYFQVQREECDNMRSETRPLLVFMRPFHKKVVSLHERLARENVNMKAQKKRKLDRIQKISNEHQLSVAEMRRMCEFISKIQLQRQKII